MSRPRWAGPIEAGQDHTDQCGDVQAQRQLQQVDGDDMDPHPSVPWRRLAAAVVPQDQLPGQWLAAPAERSAHCCVSVGSYQLAVAQASMNSFQGMKLH